MTVRTASRDNLLAFPGTLVPQQMHAGEESNPSVGLVSEMSPTCEPHCPSDEPCGVAEQGDESYDEVFERMSGRVEAGNRIALSERETAPIRYAELVARPVKRRLELVRGDNQYHSYLLAEMFIERSRESWFDDARNAQDAAEVALTIAQSLDDKFYGRVLKQGLEVRCWAYLANAYKIGGDFAAARTAFEKVDVLLPTTLLDAYERAEILSIKASWLKNTLEFDAAELLLDEITEIYRELGD